MISHSLDGQRGCGILGGAWGRSTMPPIRLTDNQMMAILAAAHPLARGDRDAFLLEVAQLLQALPEVGDGALHRVIMAVQRKHFDPPELDHQPRRGRTVAR
jgi:hypothetical protein